MDPKYDLTKILDDDRVNLGDKNTINFVIYGVFICFWNYSKVELQIIL